jgi:MSHA type pilus biogenesis protein MshL
MVISERYAIKLFCILTAAIMFISCSTAKIAQSPDPIPEISTLKQETRQEPLKPEIETPEFVPVRESSYPLSTRTVSVSALNTPLREVLFTIAKTANLNLVLEQGVNPELPITMTFEDLTIENALDIIFDSVDYFYTVKDNILIISALGTKMFELGQPNVLQDYKISVGGDILSGTASGGGAEQSIKGDVSLTSVSDEDSYKFWESLEDTLATLLSTKGTPSAEGSQASFVVNRMTGTVVVTSSKKDLVKVADYISNLKSVLNRQVVVEARIVEVQLSDSLKYGIDWTAVGNWLGTGRFSISTNNFNSVVPISGPNFVVRMLENSNDNITHLVLRALQEQGDVKILSNPRVNIMNGQTSMLSVGRNTTFISRVETTTITAEGSSPITTFTVDTNSILSGIIFGIVPYINNDKEITLTITPIVSNLVELEAETIGSDDNSVEIKLPTVDLREMSTTVKILDGQLMIIGGLISKTEILREDKIPILGSIPVIGNAFKSLEKSYENTELIIMLIPRVIS